MSKKIDSVAAVKGRISVKHLICNIIFIHAP